jgi:hypothetical protein
MTNLKGPQTRRIAFQDMKRNEVIVFLSLSRSLIVILPSVFQLCDFKMKNSLPLPSYVMLTLLNMM